MTSESKRSSFPSIPIKIPIIHRFKNRSRRKERSISIPEDVVVTSDNAPVTLYAKTKKDAAAPVTPPAVRRKSILEAIDRATNMEKCFGLLNSPGKPGTRKPTNSHGSSTRVKNDGSVDRWDISYSTLKTADMSMSTAASPYSSPHTLRSSARGKHRVQQSMSQSKSSFENSQEISSEFSPGINDSKRSLTISELGSKRSLAISELGASFSTRPSSYSTRPPRSSTLLRTSGTSSAHLRGSGGSSTNLRQHGSSSADALFDPSSSTVSPLRSPTGSPALSSLSEKPKKIEKQISLAQSSSFTSLEHYEKLSKRRSSATQESLTTAATMLYDELGRSPPTLGGLSSSILSTGEISGGSYLQERSSNSGRSNRSISYRSIRTGSRRLAPNRSGTPSSLRSQRSVLDIRSDTFKSSSSNDDGVSSLEDAPSVEKTLRRNLAKAKDKPSQRRSSSSKSRNDKVDRSLMRRGSHDLSISIDTAATTNHSTRTRGDSKRSARTTGNLKRSSSEKEKQRTCSPRIKSDAAKLRDIPRTIEFVSTTTAMTSPQSQLDDSKRSESSKISCSQTSCSQTSLSKLSKLSPTPGISPRSSTHKPSPKAASSGARILLKAKKPKRKTKKAPRNDPDQRSSASQTSESLPSLFGTAFCLDSSSHHKPTTSPFLQYDVALNDAQPRTAIRQRSVGSLSRSSLSGFRKNSFGSLDGSLGDFVLTEEEGGTSGGMTSPSVSLESDYISAESSVRRPPGLRLPNLEKQKKKKKKPSPPMKRKKLSSVSKDTTASRK